MHNNYVAPRDLISVGIEMYPYEGWPFKLFQKEIIAFFYFLEHQNRKCSTAAPHDLKPFIICFVEF